MASRLLVASAVPLTANYYGVNKRLDHVDQAGFTPSSFWAETVGDVRLL